MNTTTYSQQPHLSNRTSKAVSNQVIGGDPMSFQNRILSGDLPLGRQMYSSSIVSGVSSSDDSLFIEDNDYGDEEGGYDNLLNRSYGHMENVNLGIN